MTERIKIKSKEVLGYEINTEELRFMAYIQYVMMNEQRLDIGKVNNSERLLLEKWRQKKYIEGGASGLSVTKEFWDAINQVLFLGYVDVYQ